MLDTQALLGKISALRQRLEQGAVPAPAPAVVGFVGGDGAEHRPVEHLAIQVSAGALDASLMDDSLRQLAPPAAAAEVTCWPKQLTFRARGLVERGRELVTRLRRLGDDPLLGGQAGDPLEAYFRETAAMAEAALRMVQAFPSAPGAQLRLCEGLDGILDAVGQRVGLLTAVVARRRREALWVETLSTLLADLDAGRRYDAEPFAAIAEAVLREAEQGGPLRFLSAGPEQPARFVACHSLTVAQVMARLVRHDPDWRSRLHEPVLAALLLDAGMLRVRADILAQAGPLTGEQRREVERHPRVGAELVLRLLPGSAEVADAVAMHHERLDGSGYPGGLREPRIAPLARLLAVCDVYAALCSPRPHRPARETRTAVTDTLLLAEQGALDRYQAERLLGLSFYPVGSAVELVDGTLGVVVACHPARVDLSLPARPVVALLRDSQSGAFDAPQYLDLAQVEGRGIVRSLSDGERGRLIGKCYPEFA